MLKSVSKIVLIFAAALIVVPGVLFSQSNYTIPEGFHDFRKSEQKRLENFLVMKNAEDPEKIERQRQYDVTWYGLDIAVDPVQQTVAGIVTLKGTSVVSSLQTVILDLISSLTVSAVNGANVSSFDHNENLLNVHFNTPLVSGQEFEIAIAYDGAPVTSGFGSFVFGTRQGSNLPLIWSLSEPFFARTWWPSKDLPEDKADSADIAITVPQELTAVSNGVLRNVTINGDGTKTFYWHESYPITTYLISVAISDYDYFVEYFHSSPNDSIPVEYYITPEKSAGAFSASSGFPETVQMLSVFSELFGPYPFAGEKYAQVEFGWGGGMEHQTATSLNVDESGANLFLVAHEVAHQWWGNMVTCRDWNSIWLNEGFATYSEGLYIEARDGKSALNAYMQAIIRPVGFWGRLYRSNLDDPYSIFSNTVYDKGAWVLHMLRTIVGDDNFFEILRAYRTAHEFGTVVTEDFQAVAESIHGSGLDWFFNQWVYGTGRPQYFYTWSLVRNESDYEITIEIDQVQTGTIFSMPLEIFIHGTAVTEKIDVTNDKVHQVYTFTTDFEPLSVTLDDDNKILKRIESNPNTPTVPTGFTLYQNYPNPFNPQTTIRYDLPVSGLVTLKIYDTLGQEIKTLVSEIKTAGVHTFVWDGTDNRNNRVSSGIYFTQMSSGVFTGIKKMILIR